METSLKDTRLERREKIILLAEDDFFIRKLATAALSGIGTVIDTDSGDQVVELYKKHNPDVLLLDIHLPKMAGKQVLKEVLAYDPSAYVVMVSADSHGGNVQSFVQDGARGFVAKPFTRETLRKYLQPCGTLSLR